MPIEANRIRLQWLDIAKGITIILMVMGHSVIPSVLSRFIFAFHMPLFFIASGITTSYSSFKDFLKKKSRGLLLPFLLYSLFVLFLDAFLLHIPLEEHLVNWCELGWLGKALWFVPVLYLSLFVCWGIKQLPNKWIGCVIILILLVLGVVLNHLGLWLPWNLATVPYASFLILLGSWAKPYCNHINILYKKWYVYVLLLAVTLLVSHFFRLDMAWNKCTPIIAVTIGAFSGTLLVFCFSKLIEKNSVYLCRVFTAIGKETFAIMAFSQLIIQSINEYWKIPFYAKYAILIVALITIIVTKNRVINWIKIMSI